MEGAQELRAIPSCSEPNRASNREYQAPWKSRKLGSPNFLNSEHSKLLRAAPSGAQEHRATRATPSGAQRTPSYPSYSELLRVGGAQELRATPSYSKLLRATLSYSKLLRATLSYSEWLLELSKLSQRLIRATRAFRALPAATRALKARKKLRRPPSYSELGAPKNSELLRTTQSTPSCPERSQKLRATILRAQSLPSPELQALLSPHNSTACGQQSPLLRASEVKNSEWRTQIALQVLCVGSWVYSPLERALCFPTDLAFFSPGFSSSLSLSDDENNDEPDENVAECSGSTLLHAVHAKHGKQSFRTTP